MVTHPDCFLFGSASSFIFCPHHPSCFPVAIPILLFYLLGKPVERGFHCDDESLRYPYKDSTVNTGVLYAVGTLLPGISVSWGSSGLPTKLLHTSHHFLITLSLLFPTTTSVPHLITKTLKSSSYTSPTTVI